MQATLRFSKFQPKLGRFFSATTRVSAEIEVFVNDKPVMIESGAAIIQACEKAGVDIPRFCYHDRLGIAGNCRMCLVQVGTAPKPSASCAMPCMPGMQIKTDTPMIKKAREGVMEFLLANHPLDCPICDQGGECDLQDQSIRYGSDRSRFKEPTGKRAVENKDFGPLVKTVMTRCIQCTRCVRFANEIAGASELGTAGRGNQMEISTYVSKALETEMSGNLIDLCPVGALTSKPYAFTARPWELKKTESIDVMDGIGSNIRVDSRGNEVMRILPRLNDDINEEWISDKTRFSYDGLKRQRLTVPLMKKGNEFVPVSWKTALEKVASKMKNLKGDEILGVAGQLSDAESMFALKELWGHRKSTNLQFENFVTAPKGFTASRSNYLLNGTITGVEQADVLLLIGTNPRYEAPILNTRIRKAYLHNDLQIGFIGEKANLNYDATYIGPTANDLSKVLNGSHPFGTVLAEAKRPMIILGESVLRNSDSAFIFKTVSKMVKTLSKNAEKDWDSIYNFLHQTAAGAAALDLGYSESPASKSPKFVYLLGADDVSADLIPGDAFVVYQGHHGDRNASYADIILPGQAYTEKSATYVNTEGRAQRTVVAVAGPSGTREDWKIIRALAEVSGIKLAFDDVNELRSKMAGISSSLVNIDQIESVDSNKIQAGLDSFKASTDKPSGTPLSTSIADFYLTNSIARNSPTMAKCSQVL